MTTPNDASTETLVELVNVPNSSIMIRAFKRGTSPVRFQFNRSGEDFVFKRLKRISVSEAKQLACALADLSSRHGTDPTSV